MSINMKYAHLENEFRWLIKGSVDFGEPEKFMEIQDRYIERTNLRLREIHEARMEPLSKLGQKIRVDGLTAKSIACTSLYIEKEEFEILSALPARVLRKSRTKYSSDKLVYSVDTFRDQLEPLVLVEVDIGDASSVKPKIPFDQAIDVTEDNRFTGGQLAKMSSEQLHELLSDF